MNRVYAISIHQPHQSLRIARNSLIETLPEEKSEVAPVLFEEFLQGHSSRIQSEYDFLRSRRPRLIPLTAVRNNEPTTSIRLRLM
mgnify:CR=1 FL=1